MLLFLQESTRAKCCLRVYNAVIFCAVWTSMAHSHQWSDWKLFLGHSPLHYYLHSGQEKQSFRIGEVEHNAEESPDASCLPWEGKRAEGGWECKALQDMWWSHLKIGLKAKNYTFTVIVLNWERYVNLWSRLKIGLLISMSTWTLNYYRGSWLY